MFFPPMELPSKLGTVLAAEVLNNNEGDDVMTADGEVSGLTGVWAQLAAAAAAAAAKKGGGPGALTVGAPAAKAARLAAEKPKLCIAAA